MLKIRSLKKKAQGKKGKKDNTSKKDKKGKKDKTKKSKGSKNKSSGSSASSEDKKTRKRKESSTSSSLSSDSSDSASVFRGVSEDPTAKTWEGLMARCKKYLGRSATELMQRMANDVGRDGFRLSWGKRETPACATAFFNRVLAGTGTGSIPVAIKRDRREAETLCLMLDHFALGRFQLFFYFRAL